MIFLRPSHKHLISSKFRKIQGKKNFIQLKPSQISTSRARARATHRNKKEKTKQAGEELLFQERHLEQTGEGIKKTRRIPQQ
jgi:hypothetical protein